MHETSRQTDGRLTTVHRSPEDAFTRVLRLVCEREEEERQRALQQMLQLADSVHKARLVEVSIDVPSDVIDRINSTLPIRG